MSSVKVDKKERETMTSPRFNSGNIVDVPSAVESESVKALNNQLNQVWLFVLIVKVFRTTLFFLNLKM